MPAPIEYEVKIPVFEGPLDLLVFLVQKNELNPKDIPIALITDQYLVYLGQMSSAELAQAGEFLVMAARLMRLKARELLPSEEKDELEEMEYELDKAALIQQMMEYQKFKEASKFLRRLEDSHFGAYSRAFQERRKQSTELAEVDSEVGLYELLRAFSVASTQQKKYRYHEVEIDDVTIENQMKKIQSYLTEHPSSHFEEFFSADPRRIVVTVCFMSILELCKLDVLSLRQHRNFATIWVYRRDTQEQIPNLHFEDNWQKENEKLRPGLVELVQNSVLARQGSTPLDILLQELEKNPELAWSDEPSDPLPTDTQTIPRFLPAPENHADNNSTELPNEALPT